jgi:hypothetical protein
MSRNNIISDNFKLFVSSLYLSITMEDIDKLESKVSNEYDGATRVLYKLQCDRCASEYWRPAKALQNSKYCSKACYHTHRAKVGKRLVYNCTLCNAEFKRFKHHADAVESGRLFCSKVCQAKFFTKEHGDCLHCSKKLANNQTKYCGYDCQNAQQYKDNIASWKAGTLEGMNAAEGLCPWLRRYIMEVAGNKCSECGWCKVNPATGKIPLQIDHIDGNYKNNIEENLRCLCPNCHSLTSSFGSLNIGKGREKRRLKLQGFKKDSEEEKS